MSNNLCHPATCWQHHESQSRSRSFCCEPGGKVCHRQKKREPWSRLVKTWSHWSTSAKRFHSLRHVGSPRRSSWVWRILRRMCEKRISRRDWSGHYRLGVLNCHKWYHEGRRKTLHHHLHERRHQRCISSAAGKLITHYFFCPCSLHIANIRPIKLQEPEKCDGWEWISWDELRAQAETQISLGSESPERILFSPLIALFQQRPDIRV